jgi:hypothetical protein
MMARDHDWKRRIGGDPWKNAIMLECEAVGDPSFSPEPLEEGMGGSPSGQIDFAKTAFQCERVGIGSDPFSRSYLVVQTGRLFVVGPTVQAVAELDRRGINPQWVNVILLNWDTNHVSGLNEILRRHSRRTVKTARIWTSHWIWEEALQHVNAADWDAELLRLFDEEQDDYKELTAGVGLRLSYSLCSLPFLRAEFRCNYQTITIDPALAHLNLGSGGYVTGIGRKYLAKASDFPQFRNEILSRYADVVADLERFDARLLRDKSLGVGDGPVDLRAYDQEPHGLRFIPKASPPAAIGGSEPSPADSRANRADKTRDGSGTRTQLSVLMLCGGLMNRVERELIDPGYELDIPTSDADTERMSILEWRLRQLDGWLTNVNASNLIPVLLLTTPDTEEIVEACCARYHRTLMRTNHASRLTLIRVAAQLVPEIVFKDGKATWRTANDGGWMLRPRGHMDALRVLAKEKGDGGLLHGRKVALVFAFNNLGDVINSETWTNIDRFGAAKSDLAIEVFQYKKNEGETGVTDKRWDQLSYCTNATQPILFKSLYSPLPDPGGPRYYSSLTWYVDLARLPGVGDLEKILQDLRFASPSEDSGQIRQDLDMITHASQFAVSGILPLVDESASSLYHYDRYLGVRTQDHVRHDEFKEKFKAHPPLTSPLNDEPPEGGLPPFLISEPRYQEYVWGGVEIATRKALPPIYRKKRIAETWEVSTHEAGRSSVLLNADEMRPLNKVSRAIDYMAKYLDCRDALSVQVHPNAQTGAFLKNLSRSRDRSLPKGFPLRVRDSGGKDESFFVLDKAPGERACLFLGFSLDQLRPVANMIRPEIERVAQSQNEGLRGELEALRGKLLDEIRGQCLQEIATALSVAAEVLSVSLKEKEALSKDDVLDVFEYHLRSPIDQRAVGERILGKEYLFAGIAVVNFIGNLADFVNREIKGRTGEITTLETTIKRIVSEMGDKESTHAEILMKSVDDLKIFRQDLMTFKQLASKLFGSECLESGKGQHLLDVKERPLLKFFHSVRSIRANCWIRIPAGTLHAWQGGGNELIELAETSDNTFRILDYGREFTDDPRDMHYLEAMYALNEVGFFDSGSEDRLVFGPRSGWDSCHRLLECGFYHDNESISIQRSKEWSFLMNPDGNMTLSTTDGGVIKSRLQVGRCRTAIVAPETDIIVTQDKVGRVFHFAKRLPQPPVVCFCLGATRWEVGVWQDHTFPSVTWFSPDDSGDASTESKIRLLIGEAVKALQARKDVDYKHLRVGISWPGFIKGKDGQGNRRFSSLLDDDDCVALESLIREYLNVRPVQFLSDFQAGLLGEIRHPLGRLRKNEPGIVVNIGRGICVAFYHPNVKVREMFDNEYITVCSAVGRWLEINLKTGDFRRRVDPVTHNAADPRELAFPMQDRVDYDGEWVRASKFFSAAGIISRHRKDNRGIGGWTVQEHARQLVEEQSPPARVDAWKLRADLREVWVNPGVVEHSFVRHYAQELAEVIRHVKGMMKLINTTGPSTTNALLECFGHIVLTGQVGQYFGLIDLVGPADEQGTGDLLTHTLSKCLDDAKVYRSDIGVAAERETEGFVYYLDSMAGNGN